MKKIGMVGGVAWPSTVDYYSEICRRSEQWQLARNPEGVPSTPEMSIESLDLNKAASYVGIHDNEESWSQFDDYHRTALQCLEASGVDFALIASNTPHHRFASIVRGIGIHVINIFEVAAKETARIGTREVLILGTAPDDELASISRRICKVWSQSGRSEQRSGKVDDDRINRRVAPRQAEERGEAISEHRENVV